MPQQPSAPPRQPYILKEYSDIAVGDDANEGECLKDENQADDQPLDTTLSRAPEWKNILRQRRYYERKLWYDIVPFLEKLKREASVALIDASVYLASVFCYQIENAAALRRYGKVKSTSVTSAGSKGYRHAF
ncbi:hypothetical protein NDU88_000656 [Pleurodeles waltl]|uniref:Uncharacterized protein n=1 Tax=Pleurodeles waltl TaxID=8319 RepID=A0AAV7V604_PLEWA|nr:hypothetical protein NDU88_000656 [Pleurodeles waltl]